MVHWQTSLAEIGRMFGTVELRFIAEIQDIAGRKSWIERSEMMSELSGSIFVSNFIMFSGEGVDGAVASVAGGDWNESVNGPVVDVCGEDWEDVGSTSRRTFNSVDSTTGAQRMKIGEYVIL
ncbi:unnamed protein product [Anisakis simplex]|uniref:Dirigent protein n=1 Tax=Anisakis simplex TaxID=6269 RepID=A0A0M3KH25_ANISI|nr:unnamed protein product [Anisakis simplex]